MKLTKRIAIIYLFSSITTFIVCIGFYIGFNKGAHEGEQIRVIEIANGVTSSLNRLILKQQDTTNLIGEFLSTSLEGTNSDANLITISNYLNNKSLFSYALIYNKNTHNYNMLTSNNSPNINKEIIHSSINTGEAGVIAYNNNYYIVSHTLLSSNSENYLIIINNIDNNFYEYINSSTNSNSILYTLDEIDLSTIYSGVIYDKECYFKEDKETISTYVPIEVIGLSQPLYLEVTQGKTVVTTVSHNFIKFASLLFILLITTNIIVYFLIRNTIVKRIVNLNSKVINLKDSSEVSCDCNKENYKDEINDLSQSVYTMFNMLSSANKELKTFSQDMTRLATFDSLTELYNRRILHDYTQNLCLNKIPFTLFFLDLDNFKKLNDNVGHEYGDKVLIYVSNSLKKLASQKVKVGRLGGDEFIVIAEGALTNDEIYKQSNLILNTISTEYNLNNYKYTVECSIGIASYPLHTRDHSNVYKYADIAMYEAKKINGLSYKIFTHEMNSTLELENKLKRAIKNNEIQTFFQPIYNLNTNKFDTVEALVRWVTKDKLIPPDKFLPIAKQSNLISIIDKQVLKDSCTISKTLKNNYNLNLRISVNISSTMLLEDNFTEDLLYTVRSFDIPYNMIMLEITEDEIISDFEPANKILNYLRSKGFLIALDDFGVGYSSFNYIKKLTLDVIKLDRSLIQNIHTDKKSLSIVKTIISLSKELNITTVCEGVETYSEIELLKSINADKIQGFYYSKPLSKEDLIIFLNKHK